MIIEVESHQIQSSMRSDSQFELIVSEHYQALFRFAMSLTRAESDASDLTQQTFYVFAIKGHQLREISKVKTWLFTTLYNAFIQGRRRQVRFPHHELEAVDSELPTLLPEGANRAACSEVLLALAKVDERFQAPLALFYLEDYSYKEIAGILGVPLGTVKSRLTRGITQLRHLLSPPLRADEEPDQISDALQDAVLTPETLNVV